jgi:hypothetical protein
MDRVNWAGFHAITAENAEAHVNLKGFRAFFNDHVRAVFRDDAYTFSWTNRFAQKASRASGGSILSFEKAMSRASAPSQNCRVIWILNGYSARLGFEARHFERVPPKIDEEMAEGNHEAKPNFPNKNLALKIFWWAVNFFYLNRHR